jgi:glycosyltransferase EpsF
VTVDQSRSRVRPVPRVLHVVGAMNVGGAETMLMSLYRTVDRRRVQFDFLVYGDEAGFYDEEIARLGGRVLHVPQPRSRGVARAIRDVREVLRTHGPFLAVHAHILHASAIALRAAAAEGVDIRVAHSHSTGDVTEGPLRALYVRWAVRSIRAHATRLVACGSDAGAYLFGASAQWMLLRNGVDLDRFRPPDPATRSDARRELGVPDGCMALGVVARLEPVKNHDFVLRLARQLADDGLQFQVLLAGVGSRRGELEEMVRELRLDDHVRFLGLSKDVPRLLAALDGLLMPSHYEGIPVALVESQAAGLPSLVSEAVSREADLGIGLVDFLPIGSVNAWPAAVATLPQRRSAAASGTTERVRAAGADVREGAALLLRLYGLEQGR